MAYIHSSGYQTSVLEADDSKSYLMNTIPRLKMH